MTSPINGLIKLSVLGAGLSRLKLLKLLHSYYMVMLFLYCVPPSELEVWGTRGTLADELSGVQSVARGCKSICNITNTQPKPRV